MKKIILLGVIAAFLVAGVSYAVALAGGFDQYGYNYTARVFNGPVSGWCLNRGLPDNCMGIYSNDKLVMKWNAE